MQPEDSFPFPCSMEGCKARMYVKNLCYLDFTIIKKVFNKRWFKIIQIMYIYEFLSGTVMLKKSKILNDRSFWIEILKISRVTLSMICDILKLVRFHFNHLFKSCCLDRLPNNTLPSRHEHAKRYAKRYPFNFVTFWFFRPQSV